MSERKPEPPGCPRTPVTALQRGFATSVRRHHRAHQRRGSTAPPNAGAGPGLESAPGRRAGTRSPPLAANPSVTGPPLTKPQRVAHGSPPHRGGPVTRPPSRRMDLAFPPFRPTRQPGAVRLSSRSTPPLGRNPGRGQTRPDNGKSGPESGESFRAADSYITLKLSRHVSGYLCCPQAPYGPSRHAGDSPAPGPVIPLPPKSRRATAAVRPEREPKGNATPVWGRAPDRLGGS